MTLLNMKDSADPGAPEQMTSDLEKQDGLDGISRKQQAQALFAAFLANLLTLGTTQAFGVFQAHYASDAAVTDGVIETIQARQRAAIAAIGSLGSGGIVAVFGFWFCPRLPIIGQKVKLVCYVGTFLMSLGLGTAAFSSNLPQLIGTQGVLFGVGSGLLCYTLGPILPEYFPQRSGLAQGMAYAAASLGGVAFSLMQTKMLQDLRTTKTLGILATIYATLGALTSAAAQPARKLEKRNVKAVGLKPFLDPTFSLLMLANLLSSMAIRVPSVFVPEFSRSLGYDTATACSLLAVISGTGIVARPLLGEVADRLGHRNTLMLSTAIYAACTSVLWLLAAEYRNKPTWIIFLVACGLMNGAWQQLANSVAQKVFGDELYYSCSGALTTVRGIGMMVAFPIPGAIVKRPRGGQLSTGDFMPVVIYTASLLAISSICLLYVCPQEEKGTWRKWFHWIRKN